jgi:putative PIN family toxin of toxin-antitoxin system
VRVVFDTNIFISALVIPGSQAGRAVLKIIDGPDTLLISKEIIHEVLSVLSTKFSHDREAISRVAVNLADIAEIVHPDKKIDLLSDEPDNRILECALSGEADAVITGDKAMLRLKEYDGIRIITLQNYLK